MARGAARPELASVDPSRRVLRENREQQTDRTHGIGDNRRVLFSVHGHSSL